MSFHVNLELDKYRPLLYPPVPPDSEIINFGLPKEDCIWRRQVPDIINFNFLELEKKRLRQGAYIIIKDELLWLSPNYYHFLENGIAGTGRPEFRLKELKNSYFKLMVRANPHATGTFDIKNRQDGRTTRTMSDALFELQDGVNYHGQINIQSKTDRDAYQPNWVTVKSQWLNYPKWLKDLFYSDFASGNNIETQMRLTREEKEIKNSRGEMQILPSRNLIMSTYPAVFNAQDGSSNVLKCIADEFCKWVVCSPAKFLTNSVQFMQVGATRKGLYEIFSSPADVNHRYLDEVYKIWQDANPDELDEFGATKNGLWRYHSNPLEGMEGFYDCWGDSEPNVIYEDIMRKRNKKNKDELLGEIRANPLNESEMFSCFENGLYFDNTKGMIERKLYIMNSIYKDETTLEPKVIWGNLEFKNGMMIEAPIFRPNPKNESDIIHGRFGFSELPNFDVELADITKPPKLINGCIGVDPYHLGIEDKSARRSMAGAINWQFGKLGVENYVPRPTFIYNCRPPHMHTFYWDMIKAAVFTRSMIQYERSIDEFERFITDQNFGAWILNSQTIKNPTTKLITKAEVSRGKKGYFSTEVKTIINILTNVPIDPNAPYILNHFWHEELLEQLIEFDENNTSKYDLVSALGQAVWGAVKLSQVKKREGTEQRKQMLEYLLS